MRTKIFFLLLIIGLLFGYSLKAQKISLGVYSGTNFSNLHGDLSSGRWSPKTGISNGIMMDLAFNDRFSLQTEIGFISYSYHRLSEYQPYYGPYPFDDLTNSYYPDIIAPDYYYYANDSWNYTYLRVPLMAKYKTLTTLQFELGAGMFYSFLTNDELTGKDRDLWSDENELVQNHDWGYLFSLGISYPLTTRTKLFMNGRYSLGKNVVVKSFEGKNESAEWLFGIAYDFKAKDRSVEESSEFEMDSVPRRWHVVPKVGYSFNQVQNKTNDDSYDWQPGFSAGVTVAYKLDPALALVADVLFERKGYGLEGESWLNYRYRTYSGTNTRHVDTKVDLDYLSLPVYLQIGKQEPNSLFVNMGAYISFKMNATCKGDVIEEYAGPNDYWLTETAVYNSVEGLFENMDYGFLFGAGYQLSLFETWVLSCEGRYTQGVQNVLKDDTTNGMDQESFKNAGFSLLIGLDIPLQIK